MFAARLIGDDLNLYVQSVFPTFYFLFSYVATESLAKPLNIRVDDT